MKIQTVECFQESRFLPGTLSDADAKHHVLETHVFCVPMHHVRSQRQAEEAVRMVGLGFILDA